MRKKATDDATQAKPPPAGSIVSCCVTLPDGSVCDVDISVRTLKAPITTVRNSFTVIDSCG